MHTADDTCMGVDCDPNAVCDPFRGCLCKPGYQGDGRSCQGKHSTFSGLIFASLKLVSGQVEKMREQKTSFFLSGTHAEETNLVTQHCVSS